MNLNGAEIALRPSPFQNLCWLSGPGLRGLRPPGWRANRGIVSKFLKHYLSLAGSFGWRVYSPGARKSLI